jgi:hypothetical protein
MSKKIKTDYSARTTNEESLSLRSCMRSYRKSRAAADVRRDLGADMNPKNIWKSRTPFPWFALVSFLLLMAPYAIKHYFPEFYAQYELAFDIWTWVTLALFIGHLLWRWFRRAPRRRYEVAVGACAIMGVIWVVMPCYNLLKGTDDPTEQYQLLAMAGIAFVLMIAFHYLWRRVRNRSAYEIQNYRAQSRRNKMKNL